MFSFGVVGVRFVVFLYVVGVELFANAEKGTMEAFSWLVAGGSCMCLERMDLWMTHLVGVVMRETVWYVEIHTRRGDGADFEVVDYQQWRCGASVDFDSGVGVRGGHLLAFLAC